MAKGQFNPWFAALPSGIEYRSIPLFPGYRVGEDGSVWSCLRCSVELLQWRRLIGGLDDEGYRHVTLRGPDRRSRIVRINVLVLELFDGPRPDGLVAAHENGVSDDNRRSNLRWATQKSNLDDRWRHGTMPLGERHHNYKLTAQQVTEIRRLYATGEYSRQELAVQFGVSKATIASIVTGRIWRHLLAQKLEAA